jgi:5'-phosphate synthase pdxT subunit
VTVRRPAELAAVDALVLPGGESTTIIRLARIFGLLGPLRERVRAGMPVYGSCAGMILLADRVLDGEAGQETIGGLDATVRRNAFGRQVASFEIDLPFDVLADLGESRGDAGPVEPVHAVFIRAPWVEDVGPDVEVLARIPHGPEAGPAAGRIVAVRQGSMLATSFHPEVTGDVRIHRWFVEQVVRPAVHGRRSDAPDSVVPLPSASTDQTDPNVAAARLVGVHVPQEVR